jgi:hypothetical protein
MFLEESLYSRLSPLVDGLVFPGIAPDGTASPYITYTIISSDPGFTFGGPDGSGPAQVQIECWAADHLLTLQTAKAAFDELVLDDAPGFGCSGAMRLSDANENGMFGIRWEFTLTPQE